MAGHSHWKQIKIQKASADKKRGRVFSKLLKAISAAARKDPNPQFNPRLRTTIEKAKEENVPQENIERAIKKSVEEKTFQEITMECYGPGGIAIIIEGVTDNTNRTVQEIKLILKERGGKWAEPGSVRWAFAYNRETNEWTPTFAQNINEEDKMKLAELREALEEHEDVQKVYTNVNP